jgi:hypothetical protein
MDSLESVSLDGKEYPDPILIIGETNLLPYNLKNNEAQRASLFLRFNGLLVV